MCMIKICECGCKTQTRRKVTSEIFAGNGVFQIEQIVRNCNSCGKSFLTAVERSWNSRQVSEVMGE